MPNTMSQVIRQYRTRQGLSQADLADAVGVNRVTIANLERGRIAVPRNLAAYGEALGIPADALIAATGLSPYELIDRGIDLPEFGLTIPEPTPTFTRDQIHPNWFRSAA